MKLCVYPEAPILPEVNNLPAERLPVDRQTEMGEMMMMGLRLVQEGVSESNFLERFGGDLDQVFGSEINRLVRMGLLEWVSGISEGRNLRLTKPGRLLGNRVFREFI